MGTGFRSPSRPLDAGLMSPLRQIITSFLSQLHFTLEWVENQCTCGHEAKPIIPRFNPRCIKIGSKNELNVQFWTRGNNNWTDGYESHYEQGTAVII